MKVLAFIFTVFLVSVTFAVGQQDGIVIPHRCGANVYQNVVNSISTVCEVSVIKHSKGFKSGLLVSYYSGGKASGYFYETVNSKSTCLPTINGNTCAREYTLGAIVEGNRVIWGFSPSDTANVTTRELGNIKSLTAVFVGVKFHAENLDFVAPSL